MALPGRDLGAAAARLLLARSGANDVGAGAAEGRDVVSLAVPLVVRESSGAVGDAR